MNRSTEKVRIRPVKMVILVLAFLLLVVYATVSVTAQDPMWFMKGFEARPVRIVIYHNGPRTELHPGQEGFDEVATAIHACLTEGLVRPSGIGFSDASLLDAYARFVSVEVFFDRPVKLHAWFDTGEPTQMLFPITGRHSDLSLVLLGRNGKYLSSPPALKTVEPLREALHALGYY